MAGVLLILVDDNTALRQSLAQELAAYEDIDLVAEAEDGIAALQSSASQEADVMLLDIIMPRMDGLSVLAELQKRERAPSVLVFTAIGNDGRLIARPSGTEPLIRIMAEGEDPEAIRAAAEDTAARITKQLESYR